MAKQPVILINLLKIKSGTQDALIAMLKHNIETVISTLDGWRSTQLIAAADGTGVIIHSQWETPVAVEAMRNDPRMRAYFPKLLELADFESTLGEVVFGHERSSAK